MEQKVELKENIQFSMGFLRKRKDKYPTCWRYFRVREYNGFGMFEDVKLSNMMTAGLNYNFWLDFSCHLKTHWISFWFIILTTIWES